MISVLRALLAFVLLGIGGCAWTAQQVNLDPAIEVTAAPLGQGRPVYINVEDERSSQILGHKVPTGGGEITAAKDPALVVYDAFVEGLGQLGFENASQGSAGVPELNVELRAIDYKVTQGFWSGGLYVDVAMKGICKIDHATKYDSMYRGHHEENIQVAQSQENNEGYINDALSQAINAALRDQELLQCIAADADPSP